MMTAGDLRTHMFVRYIFGFETVSLVDRPNRQVWRIWRRSCQRSFYNSFYPPAIVLYPATKISMSTLKKGIVARVRNSLFLRTNRKYPWETRTRCATQTLVQTKIRDKNDLFYTDEIIVVVKKCWFEICANSLIPR